MYTLYSLRRGEAFVYDSAWQLPPIELANYLLFTLKDHNSATFITDSEQFTVLVEFDRGYQIRCKTNARLPPCHVLRARGYLLALHHPPVPSLVTDTSRVVRHRRYYLERAPMLSRAPVSSPLGTYSAYQHRVDNPAW